MNPKAKDVVLLVLKEVGGSIEGKTILQKISYFVGVKSGIDLGFSPYFYGPFSRTIEGATNILTVAGALEETSKTLGVSSQGWPIREVTYHLTEEGAKEAESATSRSSAESKVISDVVAALQPLPTSQQLGLAAKVHFILSSKSLSPDIQQIRQAANSLGWRITDAEIDRAVTLLQSLGFASS